MSPEAEKIWAMANEYVPIAIKHLTLNPTREDRSSPTTWDSHPEYLRISYLFPRIADGGMSALVIMSQLRWQLGRMEFWDAQERSVRSASSIESTEAELNRLTEEFGGSALRHLSPVQVEILREKYFFKPIEDSFA